MGVVVEERRVDGSKGISSCVNEWEYPRRIYCQGQHKHNREQVLERGRPLVLTSSMTGGLVRRGSTKCTLVRKSKMLN